MLIKQVKKEQHLFYPSKVEHTRKTINRTLFSEISERKYHLIYQTILIYSPFYTAREILERYHVFYLSCNIVSYFPPSKDLYMTILQHICSWNHHVMAYKRWTSVKCTKLNWGIDLIQLCFIEVYMFGRCTL